MLADCFLELSFDQDFVASLLEEWSGLHAAATLDGTETATFDFNKCVRQGGPEGAGPS